MNEYLEVGLELKIGIGVFVILAIIGVAYFFNWQANRIRPHAFGETTLFLTRGEIEHFKSIGRKEQRKVVQRFKGALKRGEYITIYKEGAIIGYEKAIKR